MPMYVWKPKDRQYQAVVPSPDATGFVGIWYSDIRFIVVSLPVYLANIGFSRSVPGNGGNQRSPSHRWDFSGFLELGLFHLSGFLLRMVGGWMTTGFRRFCVLVSHLDQPDYDLVS